MKTVFDIVGALALVGGIALFIAAFAAANIIQGTYYGVLSVAAIAFAGVVLVATKDSGE